MNSIKNAIKVLMLILLIPLFFNGCNGFGSPDYTLNVIVSDGTTGTPEAGIYNYAEFEAVSYNYNSTEENIQIEVLVNGKAKVPAGTLIMYNNMDIVVRRIDIRDEWGFSYSKEDGTTGEFDITFGGDTPYEGTFTDSRDYSGIWKVENNDLTITFSDWADYVFTGVISGMTGEYRGENITGIWSATRKN